MCVVLTEIMLKNYLAVELLLFLTFKSVYKHAYLRLPENLLSLSTVSVLDCYDCPLRTDYARWTLYGRR